MAQDIEMPALGESVTEGTVSRWLKQVGDSVCADEPLLEVSTDKVDSEVPSPVDGVVLEILVEEDETVEVGTVVCRVGAADEATTSTSTPPAQPAAAPVVESAPAAPQAAAPSPAANPAATTSTSAESTGIQMPALGESVTEGTISRWLKQVGDSVEADEAIVEVSTDKVDSEVPSPVSGTIIEILAAEDETVEVGAIICRIGEASGVAQTTATPAPATPALPATPVAPPAPVAPPQPPAPPALPSDLDTLPGAGIPSSIRKEGEKKVVEWAYPQASSGYPGTMRPEGQRVPPAPTSPATPVVPPAPAAPAAPAASVAPATPASHAASKSTTGGYVTPIVRKLAKQQGVDLATVTGTGVGGRIRKVDVLKAAEAQKQAAQASTPKPAAPQVPAKLEESTLRGQTQKMPGIRKAIAKAMMTSLQSTAQLTTVLEVDVTRIAQLRAKAKDGFLQREGTKLTFLPFFVKAATEALKAHPKINSRVDDEKMEVTYFDYENVGIAVDSPKGLMVPVVKNCGDLTIAGIAKKINELAAKVRDGKIKPDELSGGTFTITNTGSIGALFDTPVVNYPEEAIMGLGGIVRRPVVMRDAEGNETISIRSMCYLSLSYDHRLIDGADASRYLSAVKKRLEEGDFAAEVGL